MCVFQGALSVGKCARDTRVSEEDEFDFTPFYDIMKQSVEAFEDIHKMNFEALIADVSHQIQLLQVRF